MPHSSPRMAKRCCRRTREPKTAETTLSTQNANAQLATFYAQPARDGELRADGSPGLFVDLLNECRRHAWIEAEKRRVAHACKTWSTLAIVGQAPQGLDQEIGRIEISEQLVRRRVCATAANILGLRRSTRARA
jgi:hypothetical protein